jgi:glycosyltransferase involved in cell wall biosynthesis
MVLNKFKERAFIRKNVRVDLQVIKERFEKIRLKSTVLAISPTPTKYFWLGVNQATHNLFPENIFDIPQYYSRTVYNREELNTIIQFIHDLQFETVVFSGFSGYFETMINSLKLHAKGLYIALIYHGSLSELAGNQRMKNDFSCILNLVKTGKIDRLGFVKKGLDQCINKLLQIESYPIILPPPDTTSILREKVSIRNHTHIGVFANNQLRKNVHNQMAAALMIDNAMVHTTDKSEYAYFNSDNRIIQHASKLAWEEFMFLLSQMDINLYNTYTETWGQIVVESLAMGVPCLTNNSSGVLDTNKQLKNWLVVPEHDNPSAIAGAIKETLENREEIVQLGYQFIEDLKIVAQNKLNEFLRF